MPRQVRIQFPGAFYHVMCRGDRREPIFEDDDDRHTFLKTLGEAAGRTGWRVHAYVLMGNHYHLLLETPEANLVAGMTWFQTTYTVRFNARHRRSGHLFGGRYKAVLVDGEADRGGGDYLGTLLDYIHLNPIRARIVEIAPNDFPDLTAHPWSSLPLYAGRPSLRPGFLATGAAFNLLGLKDTPRGRRAFVERLAQRALEEKRDECGFAQIEGQSLQSTLRRGWCYGTDAFKEAMLRLAEKDLRAKSGAARGNKNYRGQEIRDHSTRNAEQVLAAGLRAFRLTAEDLKSLPKAAPQKAVIAREIHARTSVPLAWIAERLHMGSTSNVSQASRRLAASPTTDPAVKKRERQFLSRLPS